MKRPESSLLSAGAPAQFDIRTFDAGVSVAGLDMAGDRDAIELV